MQHRAHADAAGHPGTAPSASAGSDRSAVPIRPAPTRYSTRNRDRVRFSCAAIAPGVEPRLAASVAVSVPSTSCASRISRSASGQPGHRGPDDRGLLLPEELLVGPRFRLVGPGEQVGVAAGPLLALGQRRNEVAGGGDGVRHERVALDPGARCHHPASVSWTMSSRSARSVTRAATTRRITGTRSTMGSPATGAGCAALTLTSPAVVGQRRRIVARGHRRGPAVSS